MSYCRFSDDDYRCDVYVYEHYNGGFMTHIARSKARGWVPRTPRFPYEGRALWIRGKIWLLAHRLQHWYLGWAPRRNIDLPDAGGHYVDSTAIECARRLIGLRQRGYNVPQYAIDALVLEEENETS